MTNLAYSPNLTAMLSCIAVCEGTDTPDGYRALFGYHPRLNPTALFDSFADHPRKRIPFTQTDGTTNYSTAAGRYQILARVYDALKKRLSLKDFSPAAQDACAVALIAEKGALRLIDEGRFPAAIDLLAPVWASLPASTYPQPKRDYAFAARAYAHAGGTFA